jgi:hypothetical protein
MFLLTKLFVARHQQLCHTADVLLARPCTTSPAHINATRYMFAASSHAGMNGAFATRMSGSADLYHHDRHLAANHSFEFYAILLLAGMKGAFATRMSGSADLYHNHDRRPFHSINFVTAHDGFSLYDLVSYNFKHNQAS